MTANIINFPVRLKRHEKPDLLCKLPVIPSKVEDRGVYLIATCGEDKYYVALNGNCKKIDERRKQ